MIFVLHGNDIDASYERLSKILLGYLNFQKIRLTQKESSDAFYLAVFSKDLTGVSKIVICENYLSDKRVDHKILKVIPKEAEVIFWEDQQIDSDLIKKLPQYTRVELFKPKAKIFWFLDSISNQSRFTLEKFWGLNFASEDKVIWQLTNRMLLLMLAKKGADLQTASKIIGKSLNDWQWQKILNQSKQFTFETLYAIYNAILKLDYMIKSGSTNLNENTLVSLLLLKYLGK